MKTIIFSNGDKTAMTFEQVRAHFMPMVIRTMKKANSKFVYNAVEEEDFVQELEIELWRTFEAYEPERENCFTTYLYYKLQKGVRNVTYSKYSLKNQHNGIMSISEPIGENDLKLEDTLAALGDNADSIIYKELVDLIMLNIEEDEKDLLKCLLDKKEYSVQDYADEYMISRQAANQRLRKLQAKLTKVIKEQHLN